MSTNSNQNSYLDLIEKALSQTGLAERITNYTVIDKGWTNIVFDINDTWIFRFARFSESNQIVVEKDFLPSFASISPIKIPSPDLEFSKILKQSNYRFIAYQKIQGEKLSHKRLESFSQKEQEQLCQSLGDFLSALHSFDFKHEHLAEYPYGGKSFWNDLWPVVEPLLNQETKDKAYAFFSEVTEILKKNSIRKCITHSDLGTNNLLLHYPKNQLAGVIDFGDIAIADPAIDFSSFYRHFGKHFVEMILEHYSPAVDEDFWLRIDYHSKRKLFFVTYFALNYGYEDSVSDLIKLIEKMF